MNLQELFASETTDLINEFNLIDERIKTAARQDDEDLIIELTERKAQLPKLIVKARIKDLANEINDARTRVGIFEFDLEAQGILARDLSEALPPRLQELARETERLIAESVQAQHDKQLLQYGLQQAESDYTGLVKQRERLLLKLHS